MLTVEQYLRSSYDPDRDYVDGELEERNLGEWEHGDLQSELVAIFRANRKSWGYRAAVEVRLQISSRRFRVPDVMVLHRGQRAARVVHEAPLVCIEVLSPEDSWARMEQRLDDYLQLGVKHVWVLDPASREAFRIGPMGRERVEDGVLYVSDTPIRLELPRIFATLDEDAGL